jgi:hypothetical protein
MKDPTRLEYQKLLDKIVGDLGYIGSLIINKKIESLLYCLFTLFSCKVRNHIASYSKFIFLCHMMLLMALSYSNALYIDKYTSSL